MGRTPLDRHIAWLRLRGLREATIAQRRYVLARLRKFLGHDTLTATQEELAGWQQGLTLTAVGMCTEISHVGAYYKWACEEGLIGSDPAIRLIRPRKPRRLPRPMSEGNMDMALRRAPADIRLMLVLAAYCGLRAGELARLHDADILERPPMVLIDGKGGRQRVVPLSSLVQMELAAYGRNRGALFPRRDGQHGANNPARVSQMCNSYLHDIGIADTLHSLRHRFATEVYARSLDLRTTQELLGHSDPATTSLYVAYSNESAVQAVERLAGGDMSETSTGRRRSG